MCYHVKTSKGMWTFLTWENTDSIQCQKMYGSIETAAEALSWLNVNYIFMQTTFTFKKHIQARQSDGLLSLPTQHQKSTVSRCLPSSAALMWANFLKNESNEHSNRIKGQQWTIISVVETGCEENGARLSPSYQWPSVLQIHWYKIALFRSHWCSCRCLFSQQRKISSIVEVILDTLSVLDLLHSLCIFLNIQKHSSEQ